MALSERASDAVAKPRAAVSRAVIITALEVEYQAVRSHLCRIEDDEHPKGTQYEKGIFKCAAGPWEVGIAQAGQGNESAALHVERAIEHFDPEVILFVGVAGGLKDVTLGDVVAVTKAYAYESGKAEKEFKPRPEVWRSTARMEQLARAQAKRRRWLLRLGRARPQKDPSIFAGAIAAGEKVVASKRSQTYRLIREIYSDALGVEMEGSGFLHAAHENAGVDAIVIRGISDMIEKKAASDASGFQEVAARHAAAFAFEVLAKLTRTSARQPGESPRPQKPRTASEARPDKAMAAQAPEAIVDQDEGTWKAPAIWNVPHRRNPNFTGRETHLAQLREKLVSRTTALTALRGMGGVGKTQLATEYAYSHASAYKAVWWVRSEKAAQLAADYAALAVTVGAVDAKEADQKVQVAAAKSWLASQSDWLLIFDNVPSPGAVADYLPSAATGHVLITSRYQDWGSVADALPVDKWPPEEAVAFLLKRTGLDDQKAALALAKELDNLPLALEHAAAYVGKSACSLDHYLVLFRKHHDEMMAEAEPPPDYDKTVGTTWGLSLEEVGEEEPAAVELINLCAFLAPDDIPLDIVRQGAEFLPEALAEAAANDLTWDKLLTALRSYSLAEISEDALSIHRLVQAVVQARLDEDESKAFAEAAVAVVNGAFPFDSDFPEEWPVCGRLAPHALAACGYAEEVGASPEAVAGLLNQLGLYLKGRDQFGEARSVHERALTLHEIALGPDHPSVAVSVNNLGGVLREQGDLDGARVHYERALKIDEAAFGSDHPEVATDVNNLGFVLRVQGDLTGARTHYERALEIDETAFGSDHPSVANGLNNIGAVLREQGDLTGAREHFERALKIDEAAFGPDHSSVAIRLNNLGGVLMAQGDLDGAREHIERAIKIDEAAYGPDHPTVGGRANNLAGVLLEQGDLDGAHRNFERAIKIHETVFGPNHPAIATYANNLGSVLMAQGDLDGARAQVERALKIDETALSADHPDAATRIGNLATVLREQGDIGGAREHFERALDIFRRSLGDEHPHTVAVQEALDSLKD